MKNTQTFVHWRCQARDGVHPLLLTVRSRPTERGKVAQLAIVADGVRGPLILLIRAARKCGSTFFSFQFPWRLAGLQRPRLDTSPCLAHYHYSASIVCREKDRSSRVADALPVCICYPRLT
eukprot:4714222-Pleurochrysis_carterae.AAC.1